MTMLKPALIAASLLLSIAPADACSFTWGRGHSPAEIRENPGVQVVTGTFRFVEAPDGTGHVATDARGYAYGRIDSVDARRRYWETIQFPLDEFAIQCGAYTAPTGNVLRGRFWISRERRNRRYRLMLWEWLPAPAGQAAAAPGQ